MAPLLAHRPRADRSFERLYKKHVGDVYRYSLAMLRNPADAEDVTQTTFLNAYRAFEAGERPRAPQNWLITIAHNVCRQRFRHSQRRPDEVEWDDTVGTLVPDDDSPSLADMQRALAALPFNQRSALVMRELEGRSYAEIAESLELSVSAVETLIFRARRAVREQLEGSLTCVDAEQAISKQLDGRLPREEKGPLRAHLRECKDCARHARRVRAQRVALKGLGVVPIPASLTSFFGGGAGAGAAVGLAGGLTAKVAAIVAASTVLGGAGYEATKRIESWNEPSRQARAGSVTAIPSRPSAPVVATPSRTAEKPKPVKRDAVAAKKAKAKAKAKQKQKADRPVPGSKRALPSLREKGRGRSGAAPGKEAKPDKVLRAPSAPGQAKHGKPRSGPSK